MNLYSSIYITEITCPQCKETSDNFEFQTSHFVKSNKMEQFTFPDIIDEPDSNVDLSGRCFFCNAYIKAKLKIKSQLMMKLTYWVDNCPVYSIIPSPEKELKKQLKVNKDLNYRNKEIESALIALLLKNKAGEMADSKNIETLETHLEIGSIVKEYEKLKMTYHPLETVSNLKGFKKYFRILDKK